MRIHEVLSCAKCVHNCVTFAIHMQTCDQLLHENTLCGFLFISQYFINILGTTIMQKTGNRFNSHRHYETNKFYPSGINSFELLIVQI